MWISVTLLAAFSLSAGQPDGLTLSDVRFTHGVLGPVRTDNAFLPGDCVTLGFTLNGMEAGDQGMVRYAMVTEVVDSKGEVQLREESKNLEADTALGGGCLPAFAQVGFGVREEPGEYTLKVTATDRTGKKSQSLARPFRVLPPAFGLVRLTTTADSEGMQPAGVLGPGHALFVNALAVGFGRDRDRHQPDLTFELRILDEKGKPTLAKPFSGTVRENVPERATSVPTRFLLALNRPGQFTVELKTADGVTHKTATRSFPLVVPANE